MNEKLAPEDAYLSCKCSSLEPTAGVDPRIIDYDVRRERRCPPSHKRLLSWCTSHKRRYISLEERLVDR